MKKGFTLAEVLITLGIIGVVAALTMPALVANYQKKVVVTRLQRFDSILNQIAATFTAEGESRFLSDCCTASDALNPDFAQRQLEYLFQHAKYLNIEKMTKGAVISFPDGSGAYFVKPTFNSSFPIYHMYLVFCPEYKKCKQIDESQILAGSLNAVDNIANPRDYFVYMDLTRVFGIGGGGGLTLEQTLARCSKENNTFTTCAAVIKYYGWEIKDDYPW